jgi:hypothetical protein
METLSDKRDIAGRLTEFLRELESGKASGVDPDHARLWRRSVQSERLASLLDAVSE